MTKKRSPRVATAEQVRARRPGEKPDAQLDSRELYQGKIFRLDRDTVRFPNDTTAEMDIVRHPGASAIVPFMSEPDGENPQILLLRQYRYAAGGYIYEVPAGRLTSALEQARAGSSFTLSDRAGLTLHGLCPQCQAAAPATNP